MKKVLIILVILTAPFLTGAQNDTTTTVVNEVITNTTSIKVDVKIDTTTQQTADVDYVAKVNDMNYKKSNDIISIKAYRKSLQIKVKEVKLC